MKDATKRLKQELSSKQCKELLGALKSRFEKTRPITIAACHGKSY